MHTAYLLLGGNMENRDGMLQHALDSLRELGRIRTVSTRKETEPWGFNRPVNAFLNQVVCLETALGPEVLMEKCLEIEKKLGRIRKGSSYSREIPKPYESRLIDIDILLYDRVKTHTKNLILPHPRLKERPFALELLEEILPKNLSLEDFY
ncbi:MAG: 2-amino-4-hydroxy-6-hydroxymethyldihydropteridine diphosphokinase [Bacteroidales bacterium]|jgi:2-amino-4-hydroxy-6-hydroxymethyldihydropteridine diphosphokinase